MNSSSLQSGKASFCTTKLTTAGYNIPCTNPIFNYYDYNSDFLKFYDFAYVGPICSISKTKSFIGFLIRKNIVFLIDLNLN